MPDITRPFQLLDPGPIAAALGCPVTVRGDGTTITIEADSRTVTAAALAAVVDTAEPPVKEPTLEDIVGRLEALEAIKVETIR